MGGFMVVSHSWMPAAAAYPVKMAGGRPPTKIPLGQAHALTGNAAEARRMPSMTAGMAPLGTGKRMASGQSSGPQEKTALPVPVEPSRASRASPKLAAAVRGDLPPMLTVKWKR
eukprot:9679743-Heterocapsa_arctica.AAC.1